MEDTAAIAARLGRIENLTADGAGRARLLDEVRGLLEEGERTLRGGGEAKTLASGERAGEEADVS